jgi:hypothetical protein
MLVTARLAEAVVVKTPARTSGGALHRSGAPQSRGILLAPTGGTKLPEMATGREITANGRQFLPTWIR